MTPAKKRSILICGVPRTRQGTWALPYKTLRCRGRADRVVRPYKILSVNGA